MRVLPIVNRILQTELLNNRILKIDVGRNFAVNRIGRKGSHDVIMMEFQTYGYFIVARVLPIVYRILQTELRINVTKIRECFLLLLIMQGIDLISFK